MMKRDRIVCSTLAVMLVLMFKVGLVAAAPPPARGDVLPPITLPVPENPAHKRYLGLEKQGVFQVPQIKARIVIIEIFSMY